MAAEDVAGTAPEVDEQAAAEAAAAEEAAAQPEEPQAAEAGAGAPEADEGVEEPEPEETEEPAADEDEPAEDDEPEAAAGEGQPDIFTAIQQEVTDLRDRYARLQAEWDNYRKRTEANRAQERVRASEKLVTDLLPVLDDLERAIAHARESGDGGSLTDGVEAIQGKLLQILGKHKVQQVPAKGEPFDAMKHQAVGVQEDASVPEETVVEVYQQGYSMGERVLRPAMVVTSTGGPARTAEAPEGSDE